MHNFESPAQKQKETTGNITLADYLYNNPLWAERSTMEQNTLGRKFDFGKPRYSLLPPNALEAVVKVLTYGSKKYEDFNWMKVENHKDRYFSAANRHLWQWWRGEKIDAESGESHLACAVTNLMFLLELEGKNNEST